MPPQEIPTCQIPKNTSMPVGPGNPYVMSPCFPAAFKPDCSGNGDVKLPFGSPQYIGMGAVVFLTLILIEIFGSPFLRNAQVHCSGPAGRPGFLQDFVWGFGCLASGWWGFGTPGLQFSLVLIPASII